MPYLNRDKTNFHENFKLVQNSTRMIAKITENVNPTKDEKELTVSELLENINYIQLRNIDAWEELTMETAIILRINLV